MSKAVTQGWTGLDRPQVGAYLRLSGVPQQGCARFCLSVAALGKMAWGLAGGVWVYRAQVSAAGGLAVLGWGGS